jgi:poly(3-hydroxybutyrate) depolymerase
VNILHVHGTKDSINFYDGGADTTLLSLPSNMSQAPGARQTVAFWAGFNGASDPVTESAPSMDLDLDVPGLDTVVTRYTKYPPGGAVELWTINGATHFPTLSAEYAPRVIKSHLKTAAKSA